MMTAHERKINERTITMKKRLMTILTIVSCGMFIACSNSGTGSSPYTVRLIIEQNPAAVALGSYGSIHIAGGVGPLSVQSVEDTSIIMTYMSRSWFPVEAPYHILSLYGKKEGSTKIVIRDSAGTAQEVLYISVVPLVSYPATMTMRTGWYQSVYLGGGIRPYTVARVPDATVASIDTNYSSFTVIGVGPGRTSLVLQDASTPPHTVTVPIIVLPALEFTEPGSMTFRTMTESIAIVGPYRYDFRNDIARDGAGAFFTPVSFHQSSNSLYIDAVRLRQNGHYDMVSFYCTPARYSGPQSFAFSDPEIGLVNGLLGWLAIDVDPTDTVMNTFYSFSSGQVIFTVMDPQRVTGTFTGSCSRYTREGDVTQNAVMVLDGTFDVPVLTDPLKTLEGNNTVPMTAPSEKIHSLIQKRWQKIAVRQHSVSLLRP